MKKNIQEELEEQYMRTALLTPNALLIYTSNEMVENRIDVKVRYVEDNCIKEQYLLSMSKQDFLINRKSILKTQANGISIYYNDEDKWKFMKYYSFESHKFLNEEPKKVEYQKQL